MQSVNFEKDGEIRSVVDNKENVLCMEWAGWKRTANLPIAKPVETVTIPTQPEVKRSPGRPRNVVPSVLNDGEI